MDSPAGLQAVELAARMIEGAHQAVVFTGAGISTPSGIPDFRGSPDSLWQTNNPIEVASLTVFKQDPQKFYDWFRPLAIRIAAAEPNPAHVAIAQMENAGRFKAVITQNMDQLHQRAGSQHVLELHGSARSATCLSCGRHCSAEEFLLVFLEGDVIPRCSRCGGILKPDLILFEEMLPADVWREAEMLSQNCDMMLIAGSSLEVIPAASLPAVAARNAARLIIVNKTPTHLDSVAALTISADVVDVLPAIARIL